MDPWAELERPAPASAAVDGVEIRAGSRVRLRPLARRDAWDTLIAGKTATVERFEEDTDGVVHVVVTVDGGHPSHRYFFSPDELETVAGTRVLVAGIGNLFLGDDGFGCAVASALADTPFPEGVEVADFGVRGLDLAYALADYDAAVLVDAVPLDGPPGTLALLEPELDDEAAAIETHGMDPVHVLRLARELGSLPARTLVVGCRPETIVERDDGDVLVELSEPVRAAVAPAVELVREALDNLIPTKGGSAT